MIKYEKPEELYDGRRRHQNVIEEVLCGER
jgi:hypothetical protein